MNVHGEETKTPCAHKVRHDKHISIFGYRRLFHGGGSYMFVKDNNEGSSRFMAVPGDTSTFVAVSLQYNGNVMATLWALMVRHDGHMAGYGGS